MPPDNEKRINAYTLILRPSAKNRKTATRNPKEALQKPAIPAKTGTQDLEIVTNQHTSGYRLCEQPLCGLPAYPAAPV